MSSNQYTKERKEDKPVLAICYDFDKNIVTRRYAGTGVYPICWI